MLPERIKWHLGLGVCGTLQGVKIHLGMLNLQERWSLCWHFRADNCNQLARKMWKIIKRI